MAVEVWVEWTQTISSRCSWDLKEVWAAWVDTQEWAEEEQEVVEAEVIQDLPSDSDENWMLNNFKC